MPGGGLYTPTEFVVYSGITDADGNVAKTTLKCSAIGSASSYPNFDGNQIIITSGDYKGQARNIDGVTNGDAAGTITVANAFDGKILEDTLFLIMGIRTVPAEVAALEGKVGAGYDGLDDNKELGSSVRGHLFAGLIHGTGAVIPDNKSLYDILGTGYIHDGTNFRHSIRRHLRRGLAGANATTVLAENKSILDAIGHSGSALLASGIGMEVRRGTGTQIPNNKGIYDYLQYLTGNSFTRLGAPVGASISADIAAIKSQNLEVQEVVIYPVSEHAGTTEITDDGASPAFYADSESGAATVEGTPNVHWLEDINFEQAGTINIISMYLEFEWEHKTSGGTAYSKIQISGDGGSVWVDVTDSIAETNATYQNKLRAGVGNFISAITAGVNKLQFRLVSWEAAGNTSSVKIRSNSYVRIAYRKS